MKTLWIPAFICLALLGAEVYALMHDIDGGRAGDHGGSVAIATFESGKNQVRQKTAGTIIWNTPSSGQILFRNDAIATLPDAEAVVRFGDHSEMVVEADSLIVFEDVSVAKGGTRGKIVARLVRGSVRRKDTGPMDLFVKFSDDPGAQPYKLSDSGGGAVFRVTYRGEGIEVTVESGGLRFAERDVAAKQMLTIRNGIVSVAPATGSLATPKLPFPTLRKPRIEIRKVRKNPEKSSSIRQRILDLCEELLGIESACADDSPWKVEIHFSWDAVPGAASYLIQIARDSEFKDKAIETNVNATTYDYRTFPPKDPENLYMRVAGVDPSGNVGEFSPMEQIHIRSLAEISGGSQETLGSGTRIEVVPASPTPKKLTHKPRPEKTVAPKAIATEETANEKIATQAIAPEATVEISYGVVYPSRSFKSGAFPSSVSSSGFVPSQLRAEYVSPRLRVGGSYLFEVANAGSSGTPLENGKLGVPVFQAWLLFEKPLGGWTGGIGPYLTDSSRFSWSGSSLAATTQLLGGALISAIHDDKSVQWRAELGIVGLGGTGGDASLTCRKWLAGDRFFGELGTELRLMSLESSYGGTLAFGVSF